MLLPHTRMYVLAFRGFVGARVCESNRMSVLFCVDRRRGTARVWELGRVRAGGQALGVRGVGRERVRG